MKCLLALAALALSATALAAGTPTDAAAPVGDSTTIEAAASAADLDTLRANVERQLPGLEMKSIAETPADGLFELVIDGQIYYTDATGEYLIDGSLIRLATRENLTEGRLGTLHMALLQEVGEENMLIYEPDQPSDRSITVFTDISCGYCRRLHEKIDTLLDAGVRVRYLMFPRAGLGSQGHKDLESVWCADDPQAAMTNAKLGGSIVPATCDNPIAQHVALAEQVGLRGTPLIYIDSGERIPGFREPEALVEMVNGSKPFAN